GKGVSREVRAWMMGGMRGRWSWRVWGRRLKMWGLRGWGGLLEEMWEEMEEGMVGMEEEGGVWRGEEGWEEWVMEVVECGEVVYRRWGGWCWRGWWRGG
uniref:hypothetical protein n=1 Tax=Micrococcus luteus TaxID=1270 RepID=UPI00164335EF